MTGALPALLRLLEAVVGRLSWETAQRLGALLGSAVHAVLPIRRAEVRRRIEERLGCDRRAARRTARLMYRHLGTSALEFVWMAGKGSAALDRIVRRVGLEHYRAARDEGRGVVIVTGHVGNWDLCACSQAAAGEPLHVVTKALSARGLSRYWMDRRAALGVTLHSAAGSWGALVRALRAGHVVGMVVDQRADSGGIDCDFLGASASTSVAAATLALRTGAALVPAFMTREPDGTHTLRLEPAIEIDRSEPVATAIARATRACTEVLERAIRRTPEQWLWLHRRWDRPRSAPARRARVHCARAHEHV